MEETLKRRKERFLNLKNLHENPPEPPESLSERGKKLWVSLVPRRCASEESRALLSVAIRALDRLEEIREAIKSDELTSKTERTGAAHANPLLRAEKEVRAQFLQLWGQLGLEQDAKVDHKGSLGRIDDEIERIRELQKRYREARREREEARARFEAQEAARQRTREAGQRAQV